MSENTISAIVVSIQENESSIYEFEKSKLLFNQAVDNERVVSHQEEEENWNTFATGRGKIVGGNEGKWKLEIHKHILKLTFQTLNTLYRQQRILAFQDLIIFYSSNVAKESLEKAVEVFLNNHPKENVVLINKNLHGHEMIESGLRKYYSI